MQNRKPKAKSVAQQRKQAQPRNTKMAKLITLLRRKEGATIDQIARALGWQRHTVHGVISGTVRKRLGIKVTGIAGEGQSKIYRIAKAG